MLESGSIEVSYQIRLLISLLLTDFPSGSSVNFYKNKLYIIGDDAKSILVLDGAYQQVKTIDVFNNPEHRIPKPIKPDFETSCIIHEHGHDHLLILGSASAKNRMKGILLALDETTSSFDQSHLLFIHFEDFIGRLKDIGEINIEGSTAISNHILLSNRANYSNPGNSLIITSDDFWKNQVQAPFTVSKLVLPINSITILGVSELCYVESKDILLLTLSSELTSNVYDDGEIGDSYIGWVTSITSKLSSTEIRIEGMINLVEINKEFNGEKIEGVCVESIEGDTLILHLVSDNDKGQSKLFKLQLTLTA